MLKMREFIRSRTRDEMRVLLRMVRLDDEQIERFIATKNEDELADLFFDYMMLKVKYSPPLTEGEET